MIRYVKHHFIDKAKYDLCVKLDSSGLVYGFSWYLDTACETWDALVLNDYDAVWPLPVRSKFGIKYFYRPFGIQQLGIFSKIDVSDDYRNEFAKQMIANCKFADLYLNEDQLIGVESLAGVQTKINRNYVLNLGTSYREIYHGYNSNTRRAIKKASKQKLEIFEHDGPDVLIDIFKDTRGERLQLSEAFYANMSKLMYQALHKGVGKVWTVYGPGNIACGGAFFIETNTRSTLLFTALDDVGKEMRAMFHLLNEYIILNSENQLLLDFEGSNDEGVAHFYRSFGSKEKHYQQLKYNGLPLPLRWLKK
ncbi:hypothetical protein Oweho_3335 [Owenweeksia hongkongensis DSM 17368]|uniref:BioF2-like acetyltransferase domain-containing protein n=1 Tax=Owenweeksia hongkongensis (strain DSM 17368 / CIP 108786 / JCM 12287 / NRRL B-23963 / UST20020801) TaxID=926562 RepID=G8R4X2_OWEHD|nr:hypothetical protein [Owenweeksia hongkongensis]AEV34286.1 hypothetical protein Oweho_3335 [Owenweeksia hongkongensis DSM 17368]